MAWLAGTALGIAALALVAVAAEWAVVGTMTVLSVARHMVLERTDPSSPRNLERSLQPDDVADLRARFADQFAEVLPEAGTPSSPR